MVPAEGNSQQGGAVLDLIYIAGPPAAGKSSLMRALTRGCDAVPRNPPLVALPYTALLDQDGKVKAVELGRRRESFPGTDTLAMNIAPVAKRWIANQARSDDGFRLVLAEGDRLGFPAFMRAAMDAGARVTVVHLSCDGDVLDRRCEARGSKQDESWRKGRATKAANLARWAGEHCELVTLDSTEFIPELLAASLCHRVPELRSLPGVTW
jgi:hypothetical protein